MARQHRSIWTCKLARRHWQLEGRPEKTTIVSRLGAYHGVHGYGTSIAGLPYNRDGYGTDSLVPETARVATNDIDQVRAQLAVNPRRDQHPAESCTEAGVSRDIA